MEIQYRLDLELLKVRRSFVGKKSYTPDATKEYFIESMKKIREYFTQNKSRHFLYNSLGYFDENKTDYVSYSFNGKLDGYCQHLLRELTEQWIAKDGCLSIPRLFLDQKYFNENYKALFYSAKKKLRYPNINELIIINLNKYNWTPKGNIDFFKNPDKFLHYNYGRKLYLDFYKKGLNYKKGLDRNPLIGIFGKKPNNDILAQFNRLISVYLELAYFIQRSNKFFYFIKPQSFHKEYNGVLLLGLTEELSPDELSEWENVTHKILSEIAVKKIESSRKKLRESAIKAAISQYMCRNLSHNLGSHSIPQFNQKLSDNIDREQNWLHSELFKIKGYNEYIQGRMEFLAEFSSNAFTEFYLEYSFSNICQKLQESLSSTTQPKTGEFEIVFKGMIDSLTDDTLGILIGKIPTGAEVVDIRGDNLGMQALYILIENVIRNLYKHSKPFLLDRKPHLVFDIQISEPIDSLISPNFYAIDIIDRHGSSNKKERKSIFVKKKNSSEEIKINPTIEKINRLIRQEILNPKDNLLREEGWGLLEMKSAAAYLSGLSLDYIDSKYEKDNHINVNGAIFPYPLEASFYDKNLKPTESDKTKNIGFRFYLPKTKFCLIDKAPPINELEHRKLGVEYGSKAGGRHKFYISDNPEQAKQFINQRFVKLNSFSDLIKDLSKDTETNFKSAVWHKYLNGIYDLTGKELYYARDKTVKRVINPSVAIAYDVHGNNIDLNGTNSSTFSPEQLLPPGK